MKISFDFRWWFGLARVILSKSLVRMIPKDKKLILFNSWFGNKYADSCKYVYDYLLSNSHYEVYWLTKNQEVFDKLKSEGKPVLKYNSLKARWKQMRCAVACSSTQFGDFSQWFLSGSILLDLNHGYPFKTSALVNLDEKGRFWQKKMLRFLHYYTITTSDFCKNHYDAVSIPDERIFISDFARNDAYFDESLRKGINPSVDEIKGDKKAFVYMPTHRGEGASIMDMHKLLPLKEIDELCEEYGWEFIIKKHFYHRGEVENFDSFKHIHDITNDLTIDSQVILYQADVLISDYSSSYIDYLLLDRPLIFYHYDLDEFQKLERNIIIPFEKLDFCPSAKTRGQLFEEIKKICVSDADKYAEKRRAFVPTYFENTISEGRKKTKEIIDKLIERYYN